MLRPALAVTLCFIACGPDSGGLPPTGIYHIEAVTLENPCDPVLDDATVIDEYIEVNEGSIILGYSGFVAPPTCADCQPLTSWFHIDARPDADGNYVAGTDAWTEANGCRRRQQLELEILGDTSMRARITDEYVDLGGCPWGGPEPDGCALVREYTYTLADACTDCAPEASGGDER